MDVFGYIFVHLFYSSSRNNKMINFTFFYLIILFILPFDAKKEQCTAADKQMTKYLPGLMGKNVALLVNHTAMIDNVHLLDTLLSHQIKIKKIFAPEHGFRGNAEAGEHVISDMDEKTGTPIVSLYGKSYKPTAEQLVDVDVIVFDIQDAGARFFTYISTMYYAMQAAAENDVEFLVLDRPNPLGDYIDGPILDTNFRSFVGMLPIPIVHGLTVGELARMILGENWLKTNNKLKLTVIPVQNYTHSMVCPLKIKPSPNLPNLLSVRIYPSLCFFEATKISIGRGTDFPFQVVGAPDAVFKDFSFVPQDKPGMQMNPLHEGKICYGKDLRTLPIENRFTLKYFLDFYNTSADKANFIANRKWFNLLAGTDVLAKQIESGKTEQEIRLSWKKPLEEYNEIRKKYLLYEDFQ